MRAARLSFSAGPGRDCCGQRVSLGPLVQVETVVSNGCLQVHWSGWRLLKAARVSKSVDPGGALLRAARVSRTAGPGGALLRATRVSRSSGPGEALLRAVRVSRPAGPGSVSFESSACL